jgi:hypothetical protein
MEPHREDQTVLPSGAERKPKRFRIVKLEERIAPKQGGKGTNNTCGAIATCALGCTYTCPPYCHGG